MSDLLIVQKVNYFLFFSTEYESQNILISQLKSEHKNIGTEKEKCVNSYNDATFIYSGDVMEKKNGVTISLQYNININLF